MIHMSAYRGCTNYSINKIFPADRKPFTCILRHRRCCLKWIEEIKFPVTDIAIIVSVESDLFLVWYIVLLHVVAIDPSTTATSSGRTSPGRTSPGRTSPGRTSPGKTSPERTSPGNSSPGGVHVDLCESTSSS